MTNEHPLEPLRRLERQLRDTLRGIGVEVADFAVSTGERGDFVTVVLVPLPNPPAPRADNPEFEAIVDAQLKHELAERAEREREELIEMREHLRDPRRGFLE